MLLPEPATAQSDPPNDVGQITATTAKRVDGDYNIHLKWTAVEDPYVYYQVSRRVVSDDTDYTVVALRISQPGFNDPGVRRERYEYRVTAHKRGASSAASTISVKPSEHRGKVVNVTYTSSDDGVELRWESQNHDHDHARYIIKRRDGDDQRYQVVGNTEEKSFFDGDAPRFNDEVRYSIRAVRSYQDGNVIHHGSQTPAIHWVYHIPPTPDTPAGMSLSTSTNEVNGVRISYITVRWTAHENDENVAQYQVLRLTEGEAEPVVIATVGRDVTRHVDYDAPYRVSLTYSVRAVGAGGEVGAPLTFGVPVSRSAVNPADVDDLSATLALGSTASATVRLTSSFETVDGGMMPTASSSCAKRPPRPRTRSRAAASGTNATATMTATSSGPNRRHRTTTRSPSSAAPTSTWSAARQT